MSEEKESGKRKLDDGNEPSGDAKSVLTVSRLRDGASEIGIDGKTVARLSPADAVTVALALRGHAFRRLCDAAEAKRLGLIEEGYASKLRELMRDVTEEFDDCDVEEKVYDRVERFLRE